MSQEPKDTTKYNAIWHVATVDGQPTKLYSLTKYSLDKLENAPTREDFQKLRGQYDALFEALHPVLLATLKQELLKVLDTENHRVRTLLMRIPNSGAYNYGLTMEALRELVAEGKAVEVKWGWHKAKEKDKDEKG